MKRFLIMLSLMFILSSSLSAQDRATGSIEVTGKSEMTIIPDRIYIDITLKEADNKKMDITSLEQSMIKVLKSQKINIKKNLTLKDLSSAFQKVIFKGKQSKIEKKYQLLVKDAESAAQVILALQDAGIANVDIDHFESSEIEKYKDECSVEAIKKARDRAELLAKALGQKVGKAIQVQDSYPYQRYMGIYKADMNIQDEAAPAEEYLVPDVDFSIKIESRITIKFELL